MVGFMIGYPNMPTNKQDLGVWSINVASNKISCLRQNILDDYLLENTSRNTNEE